ncbi:MAG: helix-turn-helix domain-containing protein [Acidobacteria bacterium]|nr:helix-turn-helix domain-containing protein [Acidobacteriota bacterium]
MAVAAALVERVEADKSETLAEARRARGELVAEALAAGASLRDIARRVGVSHVTVIAWRDWGRK